MTSQDRRLARLYRRWVDATVANCEACRRAVIEQEGVAPQSVVVLANGIDLDLFLRIPVGPPALNGRPRRVGMVANLRPVKAPDVFVRAAAIVAAKHPSVIFQIAGMGDEEFLRQVAQQCGISDRLELLGRVSDIPAFLAGLDVAVLTSDSEGLSNALLEYMAAARPIVATAVGGNPGLIEHGVQGVLVPPQCPEAVALAVDSLLGAPNIAGELGAAARQRVVATYSHKAMLSQCETFYWDLARGSQTDE